MDTVDSNHHIPDRFLLCGCLQGESQGEKNALIFYRRLCNKSRRVPETTGNDASNLQDSSLKIILIKK